jgi:hypothetical protein
VIKAFCDAGVSEGEMGKKVRGSTSATPTSFPPIDPQSNKNRLSTISKIDPPKIGKDASKNERQKIIIINTYHIQSHHGVHLNGSVEIPEQDRHGQ